MRKSYVALIGAVVMGGMVSVGQHGVYAARDGGNDGENKKLPTPQHGVLAEFEGKWKGKGVLRTSGKTENEVVRCQLDSALIYDSRFLVQNGKCSAVGRTVSFQITLAYDKIAKQFTGSWINSINLGIWNMNGEKDDRNLNFKVVHDDPDHNKKVESTVDMVWENKNQYRLVMTSADVDTGKDFERSNIVFKRR